jgi:serine/threonine protein kinase
LKQESNTTGSFLVHDECQDTRCLTVRGKDSITHYKIQSQDGLFFIVEQTKFKMLQDLVYHYTTHQSSGVLVTTLRHPYYVPRGDDEVSRGDIQLTHKIGKGNYGDIWHGVKGETHVAVKIQNQGLASKSEFLQEATVLSQLDHPKIIHCEGVCSSEEPAYLLTEFLKFGNLVDYLQKGEGKDVHFLDLVSFGLQVAMGMAYLERQGYIHCDLAARSVAVGEGKLCKIQNFERARRASCYKLPPRTSVPVRWTAPEVFATNEYTNKADVWAFGVVLVEIITRGGRPYNHMTNEETLKAVQSGYRMSQPPSCPRGLYEVMLKCWCAESDSRVRFEALEWQLEEFFVSQCFEDRTYIAPFQTKH